MEINYQKLEKAILDKKTNFYRTQLNEIYEKLYENQNNE
jgi:hypothetical protein